MTRSTWITLLAIVLFVPAACDRADKEISLAEYAKTCLDYTVACNCQYARLKTTLGEAKLTKLVGHLKELQAQREAGLNATEARSFPGSKTMRNIYFDAVLLCIQD